MSKLTHSAVLAVFALALQGQGLAASLFHVPEEYESAGGESASTLSTGTAISSGMEAIRINPALLGARKDYALGAAYHWPGRGRDFFSAGVVDGKTSPVAAGIAYQGVLGDYNAKEDLRRYQSTYVDSPVKRRAALAFGSALGQVSVGAGVQYVEASRVDDELEDKKTGFTAGLGLQSAFTKNFLAGISVENLGNNKIKEFAPQVYRGGVGFLVNNNLLFHTDMRWRERVPIFEDEEWSYALHRGSSEDELAEKQEWEKMLVAGMQVRAFSLMRFGASFGQEIAGRAGEIRQSAGAGVSFTNEKVVLGYTMQKPYLASALLQHSMSLGIDVSM